MGSQQPILDATLPTELCHTGMCLEQGDIRVKELACTVQAKQV